MQAVPRVPVAISDIGAYERPAAVGVFAPAAQVSNLRYFPNPVVDRLFVQADIAGAATDIPVQFFSLDCRLLRSEIYSAAVIAAGTWVAVPESGGGAVWMRVGNAVVLVI